MYIYINIKSGGNFNGIFELFISGKMDEKIECLLHKPVDPSLNNSMHIKKSI